jgi:hypothetical protein
MLANFGIGTLAQDRFKFDAILLAMSLPLLKRRVTFARIFVMCSYSESQFSR